MTQKKKGSRSCLDMFMRVPSLAANHPVRGDTSAHHIFVCGHPDLNWSILNVRVLALTHGDDIRSSLWGGCIPQPGSSWAVTILVFQSFACHLRGSVASRQIDILSSQHPGREWPSGPLHISTVST